MIKWREGTDAEFGHDLDVGRGRLMAWIGNTVSAHRRKGHHPQPRWKVKTVNGKRTPVVSRWVCDCGATLRP